MVSEERRQQWRDAGRYVELAQPGDEDLGPLKLLPGTWKNTGAFDGRGWNMIALPFATGDAPFNYRLLVNRYNEELKFSLVDKGVPNRGIARQPGGDTVNTDQLVVTLDYEQMIKQTAAEDRVATPVPAGQPLPESGLAGDAGLAIHHEPGLFLNMSEPLTDGIDIARLGTIPHGDSVLALGRSDISDGAPTIPPVNGLPIGVSMDVDNNPYLAPYKHYRDNPFLGLFDPVAPQALLSAGMPGNIVRTTKLEMDTTLDHAGIVNIPFIVRQANAATMKSTFWICELDEVDASGDPKLVLMYLQVIMLDFFPRFDGAAGLIRWPHVSINAMEKAEPPTKEKAEMPAV
ncbi:heme-binding protein [Actibacterium ureilyticum]|uniref:heme-binding protein n=1 Tax=Actibacterium ureilyticum TaxID=1590614 RepID=UPI000BAB04FA|nr:heme-binding protein [Actibacterium ureilyticum]